MTEDRKPVAVVVGSTGGLGQALLRAVTDSQHFPVVLGLSRGSSPALDLTDEQSIAAASDHVGSVGPLALLIDATGHLHDDDFTPEKALRHLDPKHLARSFALNAIGPALLMKHFLPHFSREAKGIFVTLSAKVGSISDNRLGGWFAYRASKAALNQLVRTASVELARTSPASAVVSMHPGTTQTRLSGPFMKSGLTVLAPDDAADRIVETALSLTARQSGLLLDRFGQPIPF